MSGGGCRKLRFYRQRSSNCPHVIISYSFCLSSIYGSRFERLHRCWWLMLETICVGNNFKMLVTVLNFFFVTNIHYLFTLASPMLHRAPRFKRCHQQQQIVANLSHQHKDVTNITDTTWTFSWTQAMKKFYQIEKVLLPENNNLDEKPWYSTRGKLLLTIRLNSDLAYFWL